MTVKSGGGGETRSSAITPDRKLASVLVKLTSALFVVVALAAGGAGASTGASTGISAANLNYVKGVVQKYGALPKFTAPGPPLAASKLAGKTIFSIPQLSTIPFLQTIENSMRGVAKKLNIKFVEYPTQGTQDQWIRGIQQAIGQHADAIALDAMNPSVVAPYIQQAKAAGIPVISEQFYDLTQLSLMERGLAATRSDNFIQAGRLMADWIIWDTRGKADVLIEANKEQVATRTILDGIESEFKKHCGSSCKYTYIDIPAVDWATRVQPLTQAALVRDTKINYVLPAWDAMTQFVTAAITASGKQGKVHVTSFNGTPFALKTIQDGNILTMDLGENLDWMAYANMDQIMRAMLHMPPARDEHLAQRMFTKQNVGEAGKPPAVNRGYGSAYQTGYMKLWGIPR
jgi:ribose transport system substrate-binding protein